jgi:hypothetical protein
MGLYNLTLWPKLFLELKMLPKKMAKRLSDASLCIAVRTTCWLHIFYRWIHALDKNLGHSRGLRQIRASASKFTESNWLFYISPHQQKQKDNWGHFLA